MKLKELFSVISALKILTVTSEKCGARLLLSGRNFDDETAEPNEWPWQVAFMNSKNDGFMCGGSLISLTHMLSGKSFN